MHLEEYDDGNRLVVDNQNEEFQVEVYYMLGAGVSCKSVAVDPLDPLQKEFPKTLSAHATRMIMKGADKLIDGPRGGSLGQTPKGARRFLESVAPSASDLNSANIQRFIENPDSFGTPPSLA